MREHNVGIIRNGVTGRMGTNQHLMRSIVAIRKRGGVRVGQEAVLPGPVLVGRNPEKLKSLVEMSGVRKWATNLDEALSDSHNAVYFDSQTTERRVGGVTKAITAGKHVYCEKPTALTASDARELYLLAGKAGVKHGVVQGKLCPAG